MSLFRKTISFDEIQHQKLLSLQIACMQKGLSLNPSEVFQFLLETSTATDATVQAIVKFKKGKKKRGSKA